MKFQRTWLFAAILLLICPVYAAAQQKKQETSAKIDSLIKAALQGDPAALATLGTMFLQGNVGPQDYEEAAKWLGPLAEGGDVVAQFFMGWMCLNGNGVPQDYPKAARLLRKPAEKGNILAQFFLGEMYSPRIWSASRLCKSGCVVSQACGTRQCLGAVLLGIDVS